MADVTFTLGADDRDVQKALSRIDRSTERAGKSFETAFKFSVVKQGFGAAMRTATQALDAYAASSDYAAERVARLRAQNDSLYEGLGRDLTAAFESDLIGAAIGWVEYIRKALSDAIADVFNGGESEAIRAAERALEEQDRTFRSLGVRKDEGDRFDVQMRRVNQDPFGAERVQAEIDLRRDMERLGKDKRLTTEDRLLLQDQRRALFEAQTGDIDRREREAMNKRSAGNAENRFRFVGPGEISSGAGVRQIIGAGATTNTSAATITASESRKTSQNTKKTADETERQRKLLESIDKSLRGGVGTFQ